MTKSFAQQIKEFAEKTERKLDNVVSNSVHDVFEDAQTPMSEGGNMPRATGELERSLEFSTGEKGKNAHKQVSRHTKAGETIEGGWTANHALIAHYGSQTAQPRLFRDMAAMKWDRIVNKNARKERDK